MPSGIKRLSYVHTIERKGVSINESNRNCKTLDDLGRLVIPKEIRKQYRMKEGDSIEFFIDNDRIVIQKFDVMSKHMEEIMIMCDTLRAIYQNTVFFVKDECMVKTDHKIHDHFLMIAQTHRLKDFDNERIYEDSAQRYKGLIYPVTAFGDWYGSFIIVFDKKELEKSELYAVEAFVQLLSRQQQQ